MTNLDRQPWWRGTGATALALVVLLFTLAFLIDREAGLAAAHESRRLLALGRVVSDFGLSGYMMVLSLVIAGVAGVVVRRSDRLPTIRAAWMLAERALFFFAAIATSGIACQILKHLFGRARPRFIETLGPFHFIGPTFRSGFEGFPSGHSTTAFAAALALSLLKPAWSVVFYAAAITICVSRVLAEAHYPSDTVAGATLGTVVTLFVARAFRARTIAFPAGSGAGPVRLVAGGAGDRRLEDRSRAL